MCMRGCEQQCILMNQRIGITHRFRKIGEGCDNFVFIQLRFGKCLLSDDVKYAPYFLISAGNLLSFFL